MYAPTGVGPPAIAALFQNARPVGVVSFSGSRRDRTSASAASIKRRAPETTEPLSQQGFIHGRHWARTSDPHARALAGWCDRATFAEYGDTTGTPVFS